MVRASNLLLMHVATQDDDKYPTLETHSKTESIRIPMGGEKYGLAGRKKWGGPPRGRATPPIITNQARIPEPQGCDIFYGIKEYA